MVVQTLIKTGEYRDSVALLWLARQLGALPGVADASVVMGTPANKAVLQQASLLSAEADAAGPNDLLIVVKARDAATTHTALDKAQQWLAQKAAPSPVGGVTRPRSVHSAVRAAPHANIAVVSVAGQYAAAQAWDALCAGLHVLLFSDHVALADEIALKEYARAHGLLLMGPGAGTAIINGVGLGFANAVPRGPVGIVAAAGTGLQEVSTLLAKASVGITQGIGVGGRDVSEQVGGIMILEGLKALQADPETRVIVVVSKLPAQSVTEKILAQVERSEKPTVLALMGEPSLRGAVFATKPCPERSRREFPSRSEIASQTMSRAQSRDALAMTADDLREAAAVAAALARGQSVETARKRLAAEDRAIAVKGRALRRKLNVKQRYVRGLYSGGTLCEEAIRIWQATLGAVWSNAPLNPRFKLPDSSKNKRHTAIDFGEEEFTVGRPHPLIDNTLRMRRLLREARDPSVAAIVLDVVLGYGAHPDPASELAPAIVEAKHIAARKNRELIVVTSVTGTEGDPQGLLRQTVALRKAGTIVMGSNAAAAKLAAEILRRVGKPIKTRVRP